MKRKLIIVSLLVLSVFIIVGCSNNKTKLVEKTDYKINGEFKGKYLDLT